MWGSHCNGAHLVLALVLHLFDGLALAGELTQTIAACLAAFVLSEMNYNKFSTKPMKFIIKKITIQLAFLNPAFFASIFFLFPDSTTIFDATQIVTKNCNNI